MQVYIKLTYHGTTIESRLRKVAIGRSAIRTVKVEIGSLLDFRIADAAKTIEHEHQKELAQIRKQLQAPTNPKPRSANRSQS